MYQPENGYRFTSDSIFLAEFVTSKPEINTLEIGAGCGVISVILAKHKNFKNITAVEIQEIMYSCLIKNIEENNCDKNIKAVHDDINLYKPNAKYKSIICNPPYRRVADGRVSEDETNKIAKFEINLSVYKVFRFCNSWLENKGSLFLSYPAGNISDLIKYGQQFGLAAKRIQLIHGKIDAQAKTVLIEFKKNVEEGAVFEPPIIGNR
jgi:tRNA1Val (adenine37-N6)-methyltransferase